MEAQDERAIEDDMEVIDSDEVRDAQSSEREFNAKAKVNDSKGEGEAVEAADPALDVEPIEDGEWIDLLNNGDIRKKTLNQTNDSGRRADRGTLAWVSLCVRNQATGKEFESERLDRCPVVVGEYDLIHGIDLALPLLQLGEEAQVIVKPRFGYGTKGRSPEIGSDITLDCLLTVHDLDDLEETERDFQLQMAQKKKDRGNFWFGREEYSSAITAYKRASELTESLLAHSGDQESGEIEEIRQLRLSVCNNLSLTYIRSDSISLALTAVEEALNLEPNNVKSLYRKATALKMKGEVQAALETLQKAIQLQPTNREVQCMLHQLQSKRQQELQNEKQLYRRMFQRSSSSSSSQSEERTDSTEASRSRLDKRRPSFKHRSKPGQSADQARLVSWIRAFFANENHLNYIMAGTCFIAALFSWIVYHLIFN